MTTRARAPAFCRTVRGGSEKQEGPFPARLTTENGP